MIINDHLRKSAEFPIPPIHYQGLEIEEIIMVLICDPPKGISSSIYSTFGMYAQYWLHGYFMHLPKNFLNTEDVFRYEFLVLQHFVLKTEAILIPRNLHESSACNEIHITATLGSAISC